MDVKKLYALFFLLAVGLLASHTYARDVEFVSDPPGATVQIINNKNNRVKPVTFITPGEADISSPYRDNEQPYKFRVTLPGYKQEIVTYDYKADRKKETIFIRLQKTEIEKAFFFDSEPRGATIRIDQQVIGVTPMQYTHKFFRSGNNVPWSQHSIEFSKPNHQSKNLTLIYEQIIPTQRLPLLANKPTVRIEAQNEEGMAVNAIIKMGDKEMGRAPLDIAFDFKRSSSADPWPEFTITADIPNEYVKEEIVIKYPAEDKAVFTLKPVTEIATERYFPTTLETARGAKRGFDMSAPIGALDVRDLNTPASDIRPITNMQRNEAVLRRLNSFCITPDGQNIIYSITMQTEQNKLYSNLFMTDATQASASFSQITRGSRYFDSWPRMAREEGSSVVVFQSNRGPIDSWDISSFRLRDGRIVGGIQQLTRDQRINYRPFITSEQQPIYFSSLETYPAAEPFISHVNQDGSSYTNLGETGEHIFRGETGRIYFVGKDQDTGKMQIFAVDSDGSNYSTVINDPEFNNAACFDPAINQDGSQLLFVSDYGQDEQGRNNNNLYLMNLETSRIQQLTDNPSDDIQPLWSPTEPSVLYFLSNRGGVYNVWRMTLGL